MKIDDLKDEYPIEKII